MAVSRRPAGTPPGGQFAPSVRRESDVSLPDDRNLDIAAPVQVAEMRHLGSQFVRYRSGGDLNDTFEEMMRVASRSSASKFISLMREAGAESRSVAVAPDGTSEDAPTSKQLLYLGSLLESRVWDDSVAGCSPPTPSEVEAADRRCVSDWISMAVSFQHKPGCRPEAMVRRPTPLQVGYAYRLVEQCDDVSWKKTTWGAAHPKPSKEDLGAMSMPEVSSVISELKNGPDSY